MNISGFLLTFFPFQDGAGVRLLFQTLRRLYDHTLVSSSAWHPSPRKPSKATAASVHAPASTGLVSPHLSAPIWCLTSAPFS